MKKIASFVLVLSMLFCNVSTLALASEEKNQDQVYTLNEYEVLEKAYEEHKKNFSDESKNNDGSASFFNTNNITDNNTENNKEKQNNNYKNNIDKGLKYLKNYKENYIKKIYELQDHTIKELEAVGYDEDQIDAIKNFDGSREMLMRAATRVTVRIGIRNVEQSYSGSTVDIIADFNSKGITSNYFNDVFAVVWSAPLTYSSGRGYIEYRDTYGLTSSSETVNHTPRSNSLYGRELVFPKYKRIDNKPLYVFSGSMFLTLRSNTMVHDIATRAEYGYNTFNASPGVSYPGGISISFDRNIESVGSGYDRY